MSIEVNLNRILEMRYFSVPKEYYQRLSPALVFGAFDRVDHWQIPCSHTRHNPASQAELETLTSQIPRVVPASVQRLLALTNGADLFRLHYQPVGFDDYWIPRYRVFGSVKLTEVYRELLEVFLSYAEFDEKHRETPQLNYLAFCEVGDGNYLAVNLEGPNTGSVFFLDHEYGFYPYSKELATDSAYTHVAKSIDEWLVRLARTGGWHGLGGRFIPL